MPVWELSQGSPSPWPCAPRGRRARMADDDDKEEPAKAFTLDAAQQVGPSLFLLRTCIRLSPFEPGRKFK